MSSKLQSMLIGGLAYALLGIALSFIMDPTAAGADPMSGAIAGCVGCLVVFVAPLLAVWHYTTTNALTIPAGEGAAIGAGAAVIGAIIAGVISYLLIAAGMRPGVEEIMEMQREAFEAQGMSDEEIDRATGFASSMSNPLIGMLFSVVIGAVVGAVGGAIGAAIFKRGGTAPAEPGY